MRVNKKTIKGILYDLSKQYNVRLHFKKMDNDGEARYWRNSISISLDQSPINQLSTFFHEMGHLYCWENSLWVSYHVNKTTDQLSKSQKRSYLRVALKTERWVDRWASKEMKKHFPEIKYIDSYLSKKDGKYFTKEIKNQLYG